jgi:hypothetical protein
MRSRSPLSFPCLSSSPRLSVKILIIWLMMSWSMGQWGALVHPLVHSQLALDQAPLSHPSATSTSSKATSPSTLGLINRLLGHQQGHTACQNFDELCPGTLITSATPPAPWWTFIPTPPVSAVAWPCLSSLAQFYLATGPPSPSTFV